MAILALIGACSGCGAKTGLHGEPVPADAALPDAPLDAATEPGVDASPDAPEDASADADADAPEDASVDADADAPVDAGHDVSHVGCTDASAAYVYVVTAGQNLYAFEPGGGTFTLVGNIDCIVGTVDSMAVDRGGTAYVEYTSGSLFRVNTQTAKCTGTAFKPAQAWNHYGMGFSAVDNGPAEQLFIAEATYNHPSVGFGTVDTKTFAFQFVAPFTPTLGNAVELTGTADGRLYAYFLDPVTGSYLTRVDKSTGQLLEQTPLPFGAPDSAFAFSHWAGDFLFFVAPQGGSTSVTRYHSADGTTEVVATLAGEQVVGAGASTCAPE